MKEPIEGTLSELHAPQVPQRRRGDALIERFIYALKGVMATCAHDEESECEACSTAYKLLAEVERREVPAKVNHNGHLGHEGSE